MSDLYKFFKSMAIVTNPMWKSWLLLTKFGAWVIISSRYVSTKAPTFLLQGKEIPETSLRINTVCNFQTMKSAVELIRLLLKLLILCHVNIQKISLKDSQKQPREVFCSAVSQILLEDSCVGVSLFFLFFLSKWCTRDY